MNTTNEQLLDWVIKKIEKDYKDDVCLLIGYDLEALEHNTRSGRFQYFKGGFDYYVPDSDKAVSLSKTFIIDGIGYDLYPRSWERIESMADLNDYNTCCLGDAAILYARSDADRQRFHDMQSRLRDNLNNPAFMFKKSIERLNVAMEIYQTMMFSEAVGDIRMAAGFIADYLATSVAFVNGTYFKHSQTEQLTELSGFKDIPDNFIQYYSLIIKSDSADELKKLSHLIICTARKFLDAKKPKSEAPAEINYNNLADWYQELSYTWRRIYHRCHLGDVTKAFLWGCMLQHELNIIREEFGLSEMDLMGSYNAKDLSALEKRASELEDYIKNVIIKNDAHIEAYNTIEDFLEANS